MLLNKLRANMKWISLAVAIAFVAGGTLVYLNTGGQQAEPSSQAGAMDEPIAVVNGEEIMEQEFNNQLNNQFRQMQGNVEPDQILTTKDRVLDVVVDQELMQQEAVARGLSEEISEEEVEAQLQAVIEDSPVSSEEELEEMLEQSGLSLEDYRVQVREFMAIEKLHEEMTGDIELSEEELEESLTEITPRHILVDTEDKTEEEAEAKAEDLLEQLRDGADFAELAEDYSDDPSSEQGGELGTISRNSGMVPAFEDKAFELEVDEISEPVETEFGYHLIQVMDRQEISGDEAEEGQEEMKENLLAQQQEQELRSWLDELKEEAEIEIKDTEIKAYRAAEEGDYEKAIDNYREAIEDSEQASYLYYNLGQAYLGQDDWEQAVETYEQAIEEYPEDSSFYAQLAELYHEDGQDEKAIEIYEEALADHEDDAELRFNLGNLYRELGEEEAALDEYQKYSELAGDDLMAHYRLLTIYEEMGLSDKVDEQEEKLEEIQLRQEPQQQQQDSQQQDIEEEIEVEDN